MTTYIIFIFLIYSTFPHEKLIKDTEI